MTTPRSMPILAALLLSALMLAGCSSNKDGHAVDPANIDCHDSTLTQAQWMAACGPANLSTETTPFTAPSSPSASTSAPATGPEAFTYPNGGKVSITDVEKVASSRCYEIKPTETCVLIQVSVTNTGSSPIVLGDTQYLEFMKLYYGQNQYEANSDGYQGDPGLKTFPRQCVPGSTITMGEIYNVPTDGLTDLLVNFETPPAADTQVFPAHAFSDVQGLLH